MSRTAAATPTARAGTPTRPAWCLPPSASSDHWSIKLAAAGIPLVYIQSVRTHDEPEVTVFGYPKRMKIGTWDVEIVDDIKPHPGDIVVQKFSHDAFFQTELDTVLERLVPDPTTHHALVVGGATNLCVYHAVMGFYLRNYWTVVVTDGVYCRTDEARDRAFQQFSDRSYPNIFLTTSDLVHIVRRRYGGRTSARAWSMSRSQQPASIGGSDMTTTGVIDSDTHVDETDATWDHVPADEADIRPQQGSFDDPRAPGDYWLIDGQRLHKAKRSDAQTKTTAATRELHDVAARLRHMDELGVDVHVIYPTLFLKGVTAASPADGPVDHPDDFIDMVAPGDQRDLGDARPRWIVPPKFPASEVRMLEMARHGQP